MTEIRMPHCLATVHFFQPGPSFSYTCAFCASGWQVSPDGNIHPPSPGRIIEFQLATYPDSALFAGFQFATAPNGFSPKSDRWPALPEGIKALRPQPYPAGDDLASGPFVFDFASQTTPIFYRLAVVDGLGELHWDEPKIYDDGGS